MIRFKNKNKIDVQYIIGKLENIKTHYVIGTTKHAY